MKAGYFIIKNQTDSVLEARATISNEDFMRQRKGLAAIENQLDWSEGIHVLNFEHK